ncbi:MAG: hypothetical protein PWP31_1258 [Clostridia bacterium]|nr:hypothetical protein [Clostridia bacterium]
MKDEHRNLIRERKGLLERWVYASETERPHLIVRIMDIDEKLNLEGKNRRPRLPKRFVV